MSLLGEIESVLKNSPPVTAATIYERIKHTDYLRKDAPNVGRNKVAKNLSSLKCWSRAFHAGKDEISGAQMWSFEPSAWDATVSTPTEADVETTSSMAELAHAAPVAEAQEPAVDDLPPAVALHASGCAPSPATPSLTAAMDRMRDALDALHALIIEEVAEQAAANPAHKVAYKDLVLQALNDAAAMMDVIESARATRIRHAHAIIAVLEESTP